MNEQRVTAIVLLSMVFAGSNVVFGRMLAAELSSVTIGFFTLSVALATILPLQIRHIGELRLLERQDWLHMLCQAFFGIVLFRVLTVEGVKLTSSVDAGVILSSTPAAMTLLAVVMLGERPSWLKFVAVLLAVVAMIVVNVGAGLESPGPAEAVEGITAGERSDRSRRLLGNLLVLGAVFSEGLMTIFRRRSGVRVSHVTNTTVLILISFLLFGVAFLVERPEIGPLSGQAIGLLLTVGLFGTTVGYLLWGYGAARIPAATTAVTVALLPITAVLLGALLLGEEIVGRHIVGGCIGLVGMVLGAMPISHRLPGR